MYAYNLIDLIYITIYAVPRLDAAINIECDNCAKVSNYICMCVCVCVCVCVCMCVCARSDQHGVRQLREVVNIYIYIYAAINIDRDNCAMVSNALSSTRLWASSRLTWR